MLRVDICHASGSQLSCQSLQVQVVVIYRIAQDVGKAL